MATRKKAARKAARKKTTRRKRPTGPPKTLGACVDAMYTMREERLALQARVDEMKAEETVLREHVINTFRKTEIEGAKGAIATASISRKTVPSVTDWAKFYAFIKRTGAFELLQRRPAEGAYKERLEAGEKIPGVEPFHVLSISLRKR